jgi:hypothetical protein
MVHHVRTVAILMIVNGALQALMGLVYTGMGPVMYYMMTREEAGAPGPEPRLMVGVGAAVNVLEGILLLSAAVLNILAGARALKFRNRVLVLVGLFGNAAVLPTFYCAPTSIGVLIYGLLVFFHADVVRAFELGDQGVPPGEILKRLPRRARSRSWQDEDDDRD